MVSGLRAARHVNDTLIWCPLPRKHFHSKQPGSLAAHFTGQADCPIRQNEDWRVFKSQWHMTPIMSCWRLKGVGDDIIWGVLRRTSSSTARVPSAHAAQTGGEPSGFLCLQRLASSIFQSIPSRQKIKRRVVKRQRVKFAAHVSHNKAQLAQEMWLLFSATAQGQYVLYFIFLKLPFYLFQRLVGGSCTVQVELLSLSNRRSNKGQSLVIYWESGLLKMSVCDKIFSRRLFLSVIRWIKAVGILMNLQKYIITIRELYAHVYFEVPLLCFWVWPLIFNSLKWLLKYTVSIVRKFSFLELNTRAFFVFTI